MVPEADSEQLRDTILAPWPAAPRFFRITFTRTWEDVPNCSVHFPRHTVNIRQGGNIIHEQSLPAHGVVYLRQAGANPPPAAPAIEVSLTGGDMTWLLGGGTSWREKGQTNPIPIDLAVTPQAHLSLRLPMSRALFADTTRTEGQAMSCTYHSLRRSAIRALIDNRIAGGRLNFGVAVTSAVTRGLINRALGSNALVALVADNAPDPAADPVIAAGLVPILEAFFPDDMPQEIIAGPPAAPVVYKTGAAAYRIWQSIVESFQSNDTKRNFSSDHIGRGGPGAAVMVKLASYHVNLARNPGEADDAYFDRIVGAMLVGLQPGALLQFWNLASDFEDIKARAVPLRPDPPGPDRIQTASYGHSPIFVRYVVNAAGDVTGLRILDQHGEGDYLVTGTAAAGNRRIPWGGESQQVWIAANWTE